MRNFQKKKSMANLLYSTPVLATLGIVLLLFLYNLIGLLGKMHDTVRNKENAIDKLEELKANKVNLEHDISKLNTEEGIEDNIREKYGLVKEGEGVVIVVEDNTEPKVEMEANTGGLFNFIRNLFK